MQRGWKELESQMMEKDVAKCYLLDMTWPLARDHSISHQATLLGLSGLLTKTGEDMKRGEECVASIQGRGYTHKPIPLPCPTHK